MQNTKTPNDDITVPPRWWKNRWLVFMLLVSLLIVTASVYVFCLRVPPLVISEATTRITEPRTADGQIDFFRYFEETRYPKEMKTDENGYRIFVRTFGDLADYTPHYTADREFYRSQKYEKLGLDPDEKPTMRMPLTPTGVLYEYYKSKGEKMPEGGWRAGDKPWTLEDWPQLAAWVAEIDTPLDAVAEMVRKPVFLAPYLQDPESYRSGRPCYQIMASIPEMGVFRSLMWQFHSRGNFRIAAGNIDGAIDDAMSIYHLARKYEQDGSYTRFLQSHPAEDLAHLLPVFSNENILLTKSQLLRFIREPDELPDRPTVEQYFEYDRLSTLAHLQATLNDDRGIFSDVKELPERLKSTRVDKNRVYRQINALYDVLVEKGYGPEFKTALADTELSDREAALAWLTPSGRAKRLVAEWAKISFGYMSQLQHEEMVRRSTCRFKMKRLTLALLVYKAEHGEFPGSDWIEKTRPFLGENPERYFRCPSCGDEEDGSNYALVLYENEPDRLDTLLLVELHRRVPFEKATVKAEDVLKMRSPIGNTHGGDMNISLRNGVVQRHVPSSSHARSTAELLGLESPPGPE